MSAPASFTTGTIPLADRAIVAGAISRPHLRTAQRDPLAGTMPWLRLRTGPRTQQSGPAVFPPKKYAESADLLAKRWRKSYRPADAAQIRKTKSALDEAQSALQ